MEALDKRKRAVEDVQVAIHGMRVEAAEGSASFGEDGVAELLAHSTCNFRLFGQGLSSNLQIALTTTETDDGFCEFPSSEIFRVRLIKRLRFYFKQWLSKNLDQMVTNRSQQ